MEDADYLLLTAGPVQVDDEIRAILKQPLKYHRSADFIKIYNQVTADLRYLFRTEHETLILTSSGTGAMEAAVTNFFSPGDKVIVVANGKFSERWKIICRAYQLEISGISIPWGKSVSKDQLLRQIQKTENLKGIFLTHCETSTGALTDLQKIVPEIRAHTEALVIVDAISSLSVVPFYMDKWGIDIAVVASQKGLGLPPGLSFIAVNQRAWVAAELAELPRFYFDLIKYRQAERLQIGSAFTPSVPLVIAAKLALEKIKRKSLPVIWEERERIAANFREQILKRDIPIFPETPSNSLTVLDFQHDNIANKIISDLREKYRIVVSGGQSKLQGKVIRVGHMTNVSEKDLSKFLAALDEILAKNKKN